MTFSDARTSGLLPALVVSIALAVVLSAGESVRQQIERERRDSGLTLATFENKIKTINFGKQLPEVKEIKVSDDGRPLQGAISRDGSLIAFELSSNRPSHWTLGVARSDGSGLKEYADVASPSSICWSNDKSKLALNAADPTQPNGAHLIVHLDSQATQQFDSGGVLTSQCWSPDDKQIVYGIRKSIRIYDLAERKSRELTNGENPAWSPDGNWIGFYRDGAYYAVHPSGGYEKTLFRRKGHTGGPWWSPDGTLVAYMNHGGKDEKWMGFESWQLRVHRLSDASDDWILSEPDVSFSPEYQWVHLPRAATY
jgi:hypothetical protein